jgi:hypothetical protein
MTTPYLANVLLYLDRTAREWLPWWYVEHELACDPLPISPLVIYRAHRDEAATLVRCLAVSLAIENALAHRLGASMTTSDPIAWFGARFASKAAAEEAWSVRHHVPPGPTSSLFGLAWHVNNPPAPRSGSR